MIYTVSLNPSIDHVLRVDRLKIGNTLRVQHSRKVPHGKGMNVAYAVAALGERVKVVGFMGKNEKAMYDSSAERHKVECEWVLLDADVRQNTTLIDTEQESVTHLREDGFRAPPESLARLRKILVSRIRKDDWVAFCGSLPRGPNARTYRELIEACRKKTSNIVLDTSGRPLVEGIRGKPYAIKPNLVEFEEIFGERINGLQHIALKAKTLLDRGLQNVFVSMGEDGLFAANNRMAVRARTRVIRSLQTVGCGDAMLAGFLVGMHRQLSFGEICRLGVAAGAANTLGGGPGLIRKTEVEKILGKMDYVEL